jgi:hypothetical protein
MLAMNRTHKFGIAIPKTIQEAFDLEHENGNTLWTDAITKELKGVCIAFKFLDPSDPDSVGYQKICCHMVFDIKMEDFCQKARCVAGGHVTKAPVTITYTSVATRESVQLVLMIAALNDLKVKTRDVLNAYITAQVTERVWMTLGPEWGPDAGKRILISRPQWT